MLAACQHDVARQDEVQIRRELDDRAAEVTLVAVEAVTPVSRLGFAGRRQLAQRAERLQPIRSVDVHHADAAALNRSREIDAVVDPEPRPNNRKR